MDCVCGVCYNIDIGTLALGLFLVGFWECFRGLIVWLLRLFSLVFVGVGCRCGGCGGILSVVCLVGYWLFGVDLVIFWLWVNVVLFVFG